MTSNVPITVAYGDGIGPEIMESTLHILQEAGAKIDIERIDIGERVYSEGFSSGIKPEAWESLRRTKVFLKSPISTPQGKGVKSLNVTIRKTLGLFANVRPCVSYDPYIDTKHPHMDVVIVRENEEDLYAGIEHRQTDEVYQCLKLISRPGSERIVRYAFEYAKDRGRKKVTCLTKDNIMKLTDGLFHQVFNEIAAQYPDIESDHLIVDIGMARIATAPEQFDVVVVPNLYGDIVSDVTAELTGSVGLGASANIGDTSAMFEAIHGSAPNIAGKDIANPSGLLLSGAKMLAHILQGDIAERVHNAWLCTLEDGIHTIDIYNRSHSKKQVGTREFTKAVVERLGKMPHSLKPAHYEAHHNPVLKYIPKPPAKKTLVGVDVFVHVNERSADDLASRLVRAETGDLKLLMITNRGIKVWPEGFPETFHTDHWRCRFMGSVDGTAIPHTAILQLLKRIDEEGMDFIKTENLYQFDGEPGYSLGQGQ